MKNSDLFVKCIIIKTIITMTQDLITMVQVELISICFHFVIYINLTANFYSLIIHSCYYLYFHSKLKIYQ